MRLLTKECRHATGRKHYCIFEKERNGAFLGKTVQMIPHVANEMISFIN
jgi:CTP synthase